MDKHTCKLCFRRFHNGRALGGHMRSHVMAASAAAFHSPLLPRQPLSPPLSLASTSSTEIMDDDKPAAQQEPPPTPCVPREGAKKRFHDSPGLSYGGRAAARGGESSVVQDGESDTESSSPRFAVSRRRSKRARRRRAPLPPAVAVASDDPEQPAKSSVSDATPEEDVAMSLVMLSRDSWTRSSRSGPASSEAEQNNDDADHEDDDVGRPPRGASRHQCGVCRKVFRSYQALGGHRASIKKGKGGCVPVPVPATPPAAPSSSKAHCRADNRPAVVHECPFCFRVFESGQALGGHKRAHMPYAAAGATASAPAAPPPTPSPRTPGAKCGADSSGYFDLNVPAAATDDDFELSAVYDTEFGGARQ